MQLRVGSVRRQRARLEGGSGRVWLPCRLGGNSLEKLLLVLSWWLVTARELHGEVWSRFLSASASLWSLRDLASVTLARRM